MTLAVAAAALSVALSSATCGPAVALSWLAAVPLGMYFLSSINPNAWSILAIAAMWGRCFVADGAQVQRGRTKAGQTSRDAPGPSSLRARHGFHGVGARSEFGAWIPPVVAAVTIFAPALADRALLARPRPCCA